MGQSDNPPADGLSKELTTSVLCSRHDDRERGRDGDAASIQRFLSCPRCALKHSTRVQYRGRRGGGSQHTQSEETRGGKVKTVAAEIEARFGALRIPRSALHVEEEQYALSPFSAVSRSQQKRRPLASIGERCVPRPSLPKLTKKGSHDGAARSEKSTQKTCPPCTMHEK